MINEVNRLELVLARRIIIEESSVISTTTTDDDDVCVWCIGVTSYECIIVIYCFGRLVIAPKHLILTTQRI